MNSSEKLKQIIQLVREHATNLALFATIYKSILLILKILSSHCEKKFITTNSETSGSHLAAYLRYCGRSLVSLIGKTTSLKLANQHYTTGTACVLRFFIFCHVWAHEYIRSHSFRKQYSSGISLRHQRHNHRKQSKIIRSNKNNNGWSSAIFASRADCWLDRWIYGMGAIHINQLSNCIIFGKSRHCGDIPAPKYDNTAAAKNPTPKPL